jgi:hypothetical protein
MSSSEPAYVATLVFTDRKSFEAMKAAQSAKPKEEPKDGAEAPKAYPKMWSRDPEKIYYEGKLVSMTEAGPYKGT